MPAHQRSDIERVHLQDALVLGHGLLRASQFLQGQGIVQASRDARRRLLQRLLKFGQGAIHITQTQVGLSCQAALSQQLFFVAACRQQVNQAYTVGQVVWLQLQDAPVGGNGVIDATVDDIGIDEDTVLGDGLLDLALAHVDFTQHLVDIEILWCDVDDLQTLFSSRSQQTVIDITLDILHGFDYLHPLIFRQIRGAGQQRIRYIFEFARVARAASHLSKQIFGAGCPGRLLRRRIYRHKQRFGRRNKRSLSERRWHDGLSLHGRLLNWRWRHDGGRLRWRGLLCRDWRRHNWRGWRRRRA